MFQTMLLAYDGSQSGREALDQGAELASVNDAHICLLAVISQTYAATLIESDSSARYEAHAFDHEHHVLSEGEGMLRKRGLAVESRLTVGQPAQEIIRIADEIRADLIVVGHHNRNAFVRWWAGSTDEYILAHAPCSVLICLPAVTSGQHS